MGRRKSKAKKNAPIPPVPPQPVVYMIPDQIPTKQGLKKQLGFWDFVQSQTKTPVHSLTNLQVIQYFRDWVDVRSVMMNRDENGGDIRAYAVAELYRDARLLVDKRDFEPQPPEPLRAEKLEAALSALDQLVHWTARVTQQLKEFSAE